jgi:glycosyltransferase involved in cell wall biosynthesis
MGAMNTPTVIQKTAAPLHIAMVTETYPPEINGVAITLLHFVQGMRRRGHTVHLVRPRQRKDDAAAPDTGYVETLTAGMPIPGYPGLRMGLPSRKMLMREWIARRPDIVHVATEGPLGWSAVSAARKLGIPVSTDFHTNFHSYTGHYGIGLLKQPMAAYLRRFHNRTDCTIVPTVTLRDELVEDGYKDVLIIERGVDTRLFHPARRSLKLRKSWGVDEHTPVALLVSRLAPEKNLPVVLEAFEAMRTLNPSSRLIMVGDGPARAELEKRYRPQVIFAGMRTGEDLAAHYASADIFLYPSLTETFGNVTVEAMASGLATIAYDYAAAHQHIRHDVNGLVAPYADTEAFIFAARALMGDPARIARLRRDARRTVENLTWDRIMEHMESLFHEILRMRGAKHVQAEISPAAD